MARVSDPDRPERNHTMTDTTEHQPIAVAAAVPAHLSAGLRGVAPVEVPIPRVETPEDARARRATVQEGLNALWRRHRSTRYAHAALADFSDDTTPPPGTAAAVAGWWDTGARMLLCTGDPGLGKTHAAYAIGNHVMATVPGVRVVSWTVADYLTALRPGGPDNTEFLARNADLLILDDLGREAMSEFVAQELQTVLNHRGANEGLRTIVTTNLTGHQIIDRYGSPLYDRLIDDAVIVKFAGKSRRAVNLAF